MIICSYSNIDIIQGDVAYGSTINANESIVDWRLENSNVGVLNILNSSSSIPRISVIENGNIGVGTVPAPMSEKLEVLGEVNITGTYKNSNRDILADTSNYILATSNILVSRINAGGGGSGGAITSGGNLTLTNNATSNTILSIANSNVVYGTSNYTSNVVTETVTPFTAIFVDNVVPTTHAQVTSSTDKYMIFTNTSKIGHTFTVPAGGLNCDILMIGGGGGGRNAGGGAGACIVAINQTLPSGTYVVNVGKGGYTGFNGAESYIFQVGVGYRYLAFGGGNGNYTNNAQGIPGGCGGGATYNSSDVTKSGGVAVSTNVVNGSIENTLPRITSTYAVMGNAGGNNNGYRFSGSGGGIGTAGVSGGNGGNGAYQVTLLGAVTPINFRNYFANGSTTFGVKNVSTDDYYIGGGGGGFNGSTYQAGGLGGGGGFNNSSLGVANTGSGAGSNGYNAIENTGSGIIIIRYRTISIVTKTTTPTPTTVQTTTFGTPLIELIRGTSSDTNTDYKIGNYNGDFKVMSAISNRDTDRLTITSSGNVGIGTANPVNELHMFDSLTNSTSLTIQNSNISFIATPVITPNNVSGGTFSVGQTTGSIDRFMIFTAGTSSFTVPAGGIICDILMIGGGGAGGGASGYNGGGGGGAGACIVSINQSFTTGTYNVAVGTGDTATGTVTGAGGDSTIGLNGGSTLYIAKGGGRGELTANGRNNGGCGGGSGYGEIKTGGLAVNTNMVAGTLVDANSRSSTFAVFGNKGGDRPDTTSGVCGVGGGGIGGAGGNHIISSINAGPGGVGLFQATVGGMTYNFRSYFANNGTPYNFGALNSIDSQYYIGGGGGGSVNTCTKEAGPNVGGIGGVGGGGAGGIATTFNPSTGASAGSVNATSGTGGTGGGGGGGSSSANGGSGGSGIVIIRYRVAPVTIGVPSVELVRGVAGDSNHDYKVGNYDGNFKIMSAVSGTTDVERLNISSVGNVGIGTSSPANELHVFDNTTTATSLIIQNNNLVTTTNTVQGTSTSNVTIAVITAAATPSFSVGGPSTSGTITSSIDKFMIFTTANVNHTFTVPANFNYDILMIGGGGAGGGGNSGGGAGACIVAINQILPEGTCYLYVGFGGSQCYIQVNDTVIYYARPGGSGGESNTPGNTGGSGGGAGNNNSGGVTKSGGVAVSTNVVNGVNNIGPSVTTTYAVMGNSGGNNGVTGSSGGTSGSGGGIGTPGVYAGGGGDGAYQVTLLEAVTPINFRHYFANGSTSFGVQDGTTGNYYIGGGGAGASASGFTEKGGLGGGWGAGVNPVANTGGGGGSGQSGGSGIIIIRYRTVTLTTTYTHTPTLTTTLSTPILLGNSAIELVRGTQGDSNTDYKLGNYNGDFKVISSSLSTDTDRLNITSAGNVGIGTTSPQVKLHVTGEVYATGNITAYFSDERLKTKISSIHNPLEIIRKLNGFYYIPNDLAHFNGITNTDKEVGLSAQEVQRVLPEVVKIAPFDSIRNAEGVIVSKSGENYLTMSYERLTPVFVEAIKELEQRNIELSQEITLINETLRLL
jgi:hypothetical protein